MSAGQTAGAGSGRFVVDPTASLLAASFDGAGMIAAGAPPPPESWGLNLNLASPPPKELVDAYEVLRRELSATMRGSGAYLYPAEFLHCTAASPAPFTACGLASDEERGRYERAWAQALRDCCEPDAGYPAAPFPLIYARASLGNAAGIFEIEDPTGAVARVRSVVRACMDHPALAELDASVGEAGGIVARGGFKVPGIIHSTFLRFGAPAEPGVADAAIQADFEAAVAAAWKPVTVMCDRLLLVRETVPYMHLHLRGADVGAIIAELPFGPA
jgi:hypothetical protein